MSLAYKSNRARKHSILRCFVIFHFHSEYRSVYSDAFVTVSRVKPEVLRHLCYLYSIALNKLLLKELSANNDCLEFFLISYL